MLPERIQSLADKYFNHTCTADEKEELARFINDTSDDNIINELLLKTWNNHKIDERMPDDMSERILSSLFPVVVPLQRGRVFQMRKWKIAAAAVLLFALSVSVYLFINNRASDQTTAKNTNTGTAPVADVAPGGNKAVLILGDDSKIILDSAGNGTLAQQGGTNIIKQQDGQLLYVSTDAAGNAVSFNTLATPKGGQYKLTLPDGSRIWLNAASSLKYPTAFTGNERKVEITGEAYFEIEKDASKPFKVQVNQMEVEVLGTHFNINSYADEDAVKTTLLEGSVKVKSIGATGLLKPGQQAQLKTTGKIKIIDDADLEETVAWKNGNFQFDNSDINTVMRQIARWYDVDITYKGTVSKHFVGGISRSVNLLQVLTMLEQTGEVKFIIEGKKVVVMP